MNTPDLPATSGAATPCARRKHLNGLDYLEVGPDQLTLTVFFLGKAPLDLKPENVVIRGAGAAPARSGSGAS